MDGKVIDSLELLEEEIAQIRGSLVDLESKLGDRLKPKSARERIADQVLYLREMREQLSAIYARLP